MVNPGDTSAFRRPVTIGCVAAATGLTPKAIRLYERRGLLEPPDRTPAGYRIYSGTHIARLRFIAAARRLGLHIDQIAEILDHARPGRLPCSTTRAVLNRRISEIDILIADLTNLRDSLAAARDTPVASTAHDMLCPMIQATTRPAAGSRPATSP